MLKLLHVEMNPQKRISHLCLFFKQKSSNTYRNVRACLNQQLIANTSTVTLKAHYAKCFILSLFHFAQVAT